MNVRNSLIAGNTVADVSGVLTSLGNNLIGDNSGATITPTTGDLIGTPASPINPLLAPLGNYGEPTQTHALLPGSPALNAGNNCVLTNSCANNNIGFNLTTDQRGAGFNRQVGSAVDIGIFESRGFARGRQLQLRGEFGEPAVGVESESGDGSFKRNAGRGRHANN